MLNASKLKYSKSPNAAVDFQFDYGEPKSPSPGVLNSSSISVDSQFDEHDFRPKFWQSIGHFQEISQSAADVQEKLRPAAEFQEKSQPADLFQEKSRPANEFQEKSRSKADVSEKSRAGKINRLKSKMFTSSSAAPATAFSWWRRQKPQKIFSDVPAKEDTAVHLGWTGWLKRFSLQELQDATDSFSNRNILGRGGFGEVYKGRLVDRSLVAVKRLKEELNTGGKFQFQQEVKMSGIYRHRNVLRLLGFCMTPTERLLVYPLLANGSVASWLRESPASLDWPTRKRIALGSASGLSYLHDHCDPKIIHRDVKAANILLDEDFEAVVGDFGLAEIIDYRDTHLTTAVSGTIGHIAPECLSTGKFSEKTDVYGYGIMLLELITGNRAFDLARLGVKGLLNEKKLKMLVDPDMENYYVESEVEQSINVALLCIQDSPMDRPKMAEVLRMLDGDELAERWNNELEKRWNKWQNVELLQWEVEPIHPPLNWIVDSTEHLHAIELSPPR